MATQPVATTATASGTRVLKESRDTHMEKVDVYSFVMICFELLTGQGPIRGQTLAGRQDEQERPRWRVAALFLFSTQYLVAMTKRCWHADPAQHPSFATSPPFAASFGT